MVESPGWEQGGLRDWAWEKGRNEGCPRTQLSSAVARLQRGKGLGKGGNWFPPPAGNQSYPQSGPGCPGLVPKNVSAAPTPAPFPVAPAGSGAILQAPGAGRCPSAGGGRGGDGAGRGGASAPPRALFPAARWQRSVDRRSCTHHVAGHPDRSAGARADGRTHGPTE